MTKLKVFFDWFFKIGLSILLVLFLVFAPFTIMPSLLQSQANVNRTDEFQSQGIFELWHIETFEGGSASRTSFLEKQAIAFEKENKGVYIVVNSMSLEQFAINVSNDKYRLKHLKYQKNHPYYIPINKMLNFFGIIYMVYYPYLVSLIRKSR